MRGTLVARLVGTREVWAGSLQWFVGLFCAVWGAMMVVAPNDFTPLGSVLLQPSLSFWGIVFFWAGAGLLVAAALSVPPWLRVAAHLVAGAALLLASAGFGTRGAVIGMVNYGVLGLGTAAGARLPGRRDSVATGRPLDLFSFLLAADAVLIGAVMLALPGELGSGLISLLRPVLPWYGAVLLGAGLGLLTVTLQPNVSFAATVAAHWLVAAAFLGVVLVVMPPRAPLTLVVYFVGFGLALALLPWLGPRMRRTDPSSLRIRLAAILAAAVAVPIIVVVSLATAQEQRLVMGGELSAHRATAAGLATNVADYVRLHRAAVDALAAQPNLVGMKPDGQAALLAGFAGAYPDLSFVLYDAKGRPLARSDDLMPLTPGDQIPAFTAVRSTSTPQMTVGVFPGLNHSALTIGAPLRTSSGFAGAVIATLPISRLADLLFRSRVDMNEAVYLIDDHGDVVAYHGPAEPQPPTNIAGLAPVAGMVAGKGQSDALVYSSSSGDRLSGFARVPDIRVCASPCAGTLGLAVVLDEPVRAALANVDAERNLAFGLLLLAIMLAGVFGIVAGSVMARPLVSLAGAMGQYTTTGEETPLPRSTTSEVARLTAAFGDLRGRLMARTEDRRRAEEALRRESSLVRLLQDISMIANEAGSATEVFRSTLELICRSTGWSIGHVWLAAKDTGGVVLQPTRIWYVDDPQRRHAFRQATESLTLAPGQGLPGRVLATGRLELTRLSNPSSPRFGPAADAGLRTGFAIPIEAGGEIAAVMEFLSAEVKEYHPMFLETIGIAGTQIGRVLERELRNRETALLDELGGLLQTSMTLGEAHAVIEQFAQKCFPQASGALFVMGQARDVLEPACVWGRPAGGRGGMAPDECWALRRGQPHFSQRAAGIACAHLGDAPGISLCVPIVAQNESLGVLQLQWETPSVRAGAPSERADAPGGLWEARERLAVTLAKQIGPAIASLRLRDTLRAQSIRDPLTGLFNRRYMEESLERELHRAARRSSGMSVMMLDIDHFKLFNDTYGHEAGDAMLSAFGALLLSETRREDIACRYGGEEFVVILSDVTPQGALERAQQFRAAVADLHVEHRGEPLASITVSVGVAVFPTHGATAKALVRAADVALYRAKQKGRARVEIAG